MAIDFSIKSSKRINDIKIIVPSLHREKRGLIWSSYLNKKFEGLLPNDISFVHDKFSISKKNVLRGIHGDDKTWKLVSCVSGNILQVVVDMRKSSKTFLKWESYELDALDQKMILLPPGFGNAFLVKSDEATYYYKLAYHGGYADAEDQFTIKWNDPRLKINWPISNPILSDRDKRL